MRIQVKFFAFFRDLFGVKAKEVTLEEGARLRTLLDILCDTPGRKKELLTRARLKPHVVFMRNGTNILSLDGLETELFDGDVVAIFPFLGGG